jgi:chromosomal replication initiator protein DnaA
MQIDFKLLWNECLDVIKKNIPEPNFNMWFTPIVPISYANKELLIQVPSQFFYEYLEAHYVKLMKMTLSRFFGEETTLKYRVTVDNTSGSTIEYTTDNNNSGIKPDGNKFENNRKEAVRKVATPFTQSLPQDFDPQLNSKYTFDNYFEGTSNKLVRTAGEAIAKDPGRTAFNPLFIFGPSGVGKTHLCHAIGARILELHPEKRVLYVSAHLFRIQYGDASQKHTVNDFMYFYQNIDVLLIDDIQELIGMTKTQEAFFNIFNHLHMLGKQLILTSDKAPVDLNGMEERLVTRMKWGLTAELARPDIELRRKILKNKISHDGIVIPNDVFNFIAENVTNNVRDLEGILVSLMANSLINNREIDLSLTKRVVEQNVRLEKKQISVEMIQKAVCQYYNIEPTVIQMCSRKREIVQARQITMFLVKKYTNFSFSRIGKIVGKKDHATVLHACKTIKDQIETNRSFRSSVEEIECLLKN